MAGLARWRGLCASSTSGWRTREADVLFPSMPARCARGLSRGACVFSGGDPCPTIHVQRGPRRTERVPGACVWALLWAESPPGDGALRRKRGAAAAATLDVRVVELETRPVLALDEVDLGRLEVLKAQGVDVELYAVRLELLVHFSDLVLEVEIVGKARAAPAYDAEAETLALQALSGGNVLDFRSGFFGDRDHLARQYKDRPPAAPGLVRDFRAASSRLDLDLEWPSVTST